MQEYCWLVRFGWVGLGWVELVVPSISVFTCKKKTKTKTLTFVCLYSYGLNMLHVVGFDRKITKKKKFNKNHVKSILCAVLKSFFEQKNCQKIYGMTEWGIVIYCCCSIDIATLAYLSRNGVLKCYLIWTTNWNKMKRKLTWHACICVYEGRLLYCFEIYEERIT